MALEVIDRDKGLPLDGGDRLRRGEADHESANEPRAGRRRDQVDLGKADTCFVHCCHYQLVQVVQMGAGGDLRYDTAVGLVLGKLAQDLICQDLTVVAHDGDGGFVTTGFNAKRKHASDIVAWPGRVKRFAPAGCGG